MRGYWLGLALMASACGDLEDGPAFGPVTIRILADGLPDAGAPVVFHDPAGEVLAFVLTSADGLARHDLFPRGGMVSAVTQFGDLETVAGVLPGDSLMLGNFYPNLDANEMQVLADPFPGATNYILSSTESTSFTSTLPFYVSCSQPLIDLAATAVDANGTSLAYAVELDAPFVPNGTTSLPAWQTDWQTSRLVVSAPPGGGYSAIAIGGTMLQGEVSVRGGAVSLSLDGPATFTFQQLPDGPDRAWYAMLLLFRWQQSWWNIDYRAGLPDLVAMDVERDFLPAPAVVLRDVGTDRPTIDWIADASVVVDGIRASLEWDDAGGFGAWYVIAPNVGEITFPALPDALASYRPTGAFSGEASVTLVESSRYASYASMRHAPEDYLDFPATGDLHVQMSSATTDF